MKQQSALVLASGEILTGNSLGKVGICYGELVFNTAMSGYQEILTDPSYAQQIILFTYPHIGNTGVNFEDHESRRIFAKGLIVRHYSEKYSSWRAEGSLEQFLLEQQTVGISDIDTRYLTNIVREHGFIASCIAPVTYVEQHKAEILTKLATYKVTDGTSQVTCKQPYMVLKADAGNAYKVIVVDFGVKQSILKALANVGCELIVVPASTSLQEILRYQPDGVVLSNGPGDPAELKFMQPIIRSLLQVDMPLFGICLGHQLLALSLGATTYKMDHGHHGANHPVIDLVSKKVLISSQNHGFAVQETSLPEVLEVSHRSLFDDSIQGITHKFKPAYGFQGHPEAGPGPNDVKYIFKKFVTLMQRYKVCPKEQIYV